jgi:sulfate transport system ATP-binding protein
MWATVRHVNAAGPVVKLELEGEGASVLRVDLSRERYAALSPQVGERLYVQPRRLRVFVDDVVGTA